MLIITVTVFYPVSNNFILLSLLYFVLLFPKNQINNLNNYYYFNFQVVNVYKAQGPDFIGNNTMA